MPIIASDAGGMPEVVRHQKNGLLIPPGDVTALADAIDQLALSARLRQQLGAAGKNIADQEFSVDTMVEGNLDVYRRTLGQTHAFSS